MGTTRFFAIIISLMACAAGPLPLSSRVGASPPDSSLAGAAGQRYSAAAILISSNRDYYTPDDSIALTIIMKAYSDFSAEAFLALRGPDGRLMFYSGEDGTLHEGDAAYTATWTLFRSGALLLSRGTHIAGVEISGGDFTIPGSYTVYTLLSDAATGAALSNIGQTHFTIFHNRVVILDKAIHVGDYYESYMAHWEVPYPQGVSVNTDFFLDSVPVGGVGLQCAFFATYYANDPVDLNGPLLGYLPGSMNGNSWRRAAAFISAERLRAGINVLTFKSGHHPITGHYDDYMVKEVALYYN